MTYAQPMGSYADHVVVPAERPVKIPDGVDARSVAAAILQGFTANYLATSTHLLKTGETALVHAAAGGSGFSWCRSPRYAGPG